VVGKSKYLCLAGPKACQIATHQAQPDPALRIGRQFEGSRQRGRLKFLLNFQILQSEERCGWTVGLDPDVVLGIFRQAPDRSHCAAIFSLDLTKHSILVPPIMDP
jgi:hypothetical protein